MSEYFNVTMDYILRGIEPTVNDQGTRAVLTSKVLYTAFTVFLATGLFRVFGGQYEQQTADTIRGSMIIQTVDVVEYFIGTLLSGAEVSFAINWPSILLTVFMPLSLIIAVCFRSTAALHPTEITTGAVLAAVYLITAGPSFVILEGKAKKEQQACYKFQSILL